MQKEAMLGADFLMKLDSVLSQPDFFGTGEGLALSCPGCGHVIPACEVETMIDREPSAQLVSLLTAPCTVPDSIVERAELAKEIAEGLMSEITAVVFVCSGCGCHFPFVSASKADVT
jgi:hypothetical protein